MKIPYSSKRLSTITQKYLRQTLVFSCEIAHYGESSISIFQGIFTSTDKTFISDGGLSTKQ